MTPSLWLLAAACFASGVDELPTSLAATNAPAAMVQPAPVARPACECAAPPCRKTSGLFPFLQKKFHEHTDCTSCATASKASDCGRPCSTCQTIVQKPCTTYAPPAQPTRLRQPMFDTLPDHGANRVTVFVLHAARPCECVKPCTTHVPSLSRNRAASPAIAAHRARHPAGQR